jgi:membrane protein DedA with SNARE-associated domain
MMEVPAGRAIPAMAAASALFYGAVIWLAYTLGSNWSAVEAAVGRMGRVLLGLAVLVTVLLIWLWSRWRERRGH